MLYFSSQETVLYALTCNIERLFTFHVGRHQPRTLAAGDGYAPPLRVSETPVLLLYEPAIFGGRNYRHYHARFRIYGLHFATSGCGGGSCTRVTEFMRLSGELTLSPPYLHSTGVEPVSRAFKRSIPSRVKALPLS